MALALQSPKTSEGEIAQRRQRGRRRSRSANSRASSSLIVGKRLEIVARPEAPGSPRRRCPDMTKAIQVTGYRASVDLETGIRRTYDWYRGNVFNGETLFVR